MKRFLIKFLVFFSIIALIDCAVGVSGKYLQGHAIGGDTRRFDDIVKRESHDILILGSSRAHHHYDTPFLSDTLGLDVFNAGFDGNGVVLAYGILKMAINHYKPKLVLIDIEPAFDLDVYAADNNHTRYLSYLKAYYDEPGISEIFQDVSMEEWYKVHSGMIRYNNNIINLLADNIVKKDINKGYTPLDGIVTPNTDEDVFSEQKKYDYFKINYIEKIIKLCIENHLPLVFVASPKYGMNDSRHLQPAIDMCKRYDIPFWDYYASTTYLEHNDWFKDSMHLNRTGARMFSIDVSKRINDLINN